MWSSWHWGKTEAFELVGPWKSVLKSIWRTVASNFCEWAFRNQDSEQNWIFNSRNKFGVWITGWLPWFGQGKEKKVEKLEVLNCYVLLDPSKLFRLFFLPWWLSLSYLVVLTTFVCIPSTNERWIGCSKLKVNHVTSFRPWRIWISVLSKYYLLNNSVTS